MRSGSSSAILRPLSSTTTLSAIGMMAIHDVFHDHHVIAAVFQAQDDLHGRLHFRRREARHYLVEHEQLGPAASALAISRRFFPAMGNPPASLSWILGKLA